MLNHKKLIVSHAPFWHNGSSIVARSYHTIFAAMPAVLFGIFTFGMPALGVVSLSISFSIIWEFLINKVTKRTISIGDGNAALIGLLFGISGLLLIVYVITLNLTLLIVGIIPAAFLLFMEVVKRNRSRREMQESL